jgi:presenilin-like A22 family membrane protease
MKKKLALAPLLWGSLAFIIGASLSLYIASRSVKYLGDHPDVADALPKVSPQFPVIYFFCAVAVIGLVLFLIPVSKLKWVFRGLFVLLYAWGVFIVLTLTIQAQVLAISIFAAAAGIAWFIRPSVWLQNVLMLLALVGIGSVFGVLLSPWPIMIFLLVVALYDYLAVRFGYMMWMAKKLTQSDSLPAFIIPKTNSNWNHNLKSNSSKTIIEGEAAEREYSILGGGDIGFPLILMVSVYANFGLGNAIMMAAFALAGLVSAFVIQSLFLKGKPMPALPPISIACLIGLCIIRFLIK